MPGKGEHSVTAGDLQTDKADKEDLVALSSNIAAMPGGESPAEREATLIMDTITGLKKVKRDLMKVGVPGCKFLLDRRIRDLERNKEALEAGPCSETIAVLNEKLRLERLMHINERDIARAKYAKEKKQRLFAKVVKGKIKKWLWDRRKDLKSAKLEL